MEKDCTNCLFEYVCSWAAAGDKGYCDSWKPDFEKEGERDECKINGER